MYNKERKIAYKDWCQTHGDSRGDRYFEYMFEYCKEFEIRFNKDLSDFSESEISEMYSDKSKFKTLNVLIVKHSQYSRYANWANPQNCFNSFKREDLTQFVNVQERDKRIVTKEELMDVVNSKINHMDQFLLLGIFEGLKGRNFQDFLNVKKQDVDLENRFVMVETRPNKFIRISEELASVIERCLHQKYYIDTLGKEYAYKDSDYVYKYRSMGEDIRDLDSGNASHRMRVRYLHICKGTRLDDVSTVDLTESGKIWFMTDSAEKKDMNAIDYIRTPRASKEIQNQYGMNFYRPGLFLQKYQDYLE